MKIHLLDEPLLQFASGQHVDIRAGIANFGVFAKGAQNIPNPIGVGLIGTAAAIDGVRDWLESCRQGVNSTEEKLRELRPDFPGMKDENFGTRLNITDGNTRTISRHELLAALGAPEPMVKVVELFLSHAKDLAARTGVHVLVVAPPDEVFQLGDAPSQGPDPELDESQDKNPKYAPSFHDLFKARALELPVPCQILRPTTYGGATDPKAKRKRTVQDWATRAWNFHVALYYKAGGVPWRLVKQSAAYSTCFVGTSFYKSIDGEQLMTSVAQIFDERGEGLIVQGGNAQLDKNDRTPHLSAQDAHALLASGLATYRREHATMPARVVLHKTSYFNSAEIEGFKQAAKDEKIDRLDLVSMRRAGVRLLRAAVPPVVRGTALHLDDRTGLVYLKGTIPFFKIYPGPYVPRALEFCLDEGETSPIELAREILELSKLNFNNTQFDSGDPITVRAARRVGDILKHVPKDPGRVVQSRFRYFT